MQDQLNSGSLAELIRQKISAEFGIFPPNLRTEIGNDGSMTITGIDPETQATINIVVSVEDSMTSAGDSMGMQNTMPQPQMPPTEALPNQAPMVPGDPF